ncbi:microbial collagenase, secreted [Actinosynnema sp. ALI-1.44]|uniref:collagenase n=1 Tax=Actinosynnema sp. ALI-1.44 TaxID=1933779 RepID=UPI00097CA2B2|nr:collagenase [Actinosynnema sp. ALI-1.44]ONI76129.1 microbial collagenase, secreted [Actinosynnema sp. ALI-1.44]
MRRASKLLLAVTLAIVVSPHTATAAPPTTVDVPPSAADSRDDHASRRVTVTPEDRSPSTSSTRHRESHGARAKKASCSTTEFTGLSGSALVAKIKSSDTDCVNTLFSATGDDAARLFREAQMITVSTALRDNATTYPGDNSTGTGQLVLYLRAGYYVHWYNPDVVGSYGPGLTSAIRAGLDAFFASPKSGTVNDANGQVLAEAITLIDSAEENGRYLSVVKRMLDGYTSTYDAYYWMRTAVNNVYTVLFRGHQNVPFVAAVQADPGLLDTVHRFAVNHLDLLGTDRAYLTANAGRELARFLRHAPLVPKTRPLARDLLDRSALRGATAPLWVGVAEMADYYDSANCSYYRICDLRTRVAAEVLPITHTCSASLRIRAQQMTPAELGASCASMRNQDSYFHGVAADPGPVANDRNTTLEVVVFDSSTDYQTYAGVLFDIDTNNGGMYLEGDPAAAGNQPRFIAYEAEWLRPAFEIWNLNHEYTHYLDGRFTMYGDFTANVATPTIWWIEGFAEYVSYHYRNQTYTAAITEAGRRTYALSTLFDTTYDHDTTRVYRWGYLAVRYMLQFHRSELDTVLGYYRTGNWSAARAYLTGTIGTRYDNDWYTWLSSCAAGNCGGTSANLPPVPNFSFNANGLTVAFSDRSTDPDGSIAARSWDFGDGTTSTATNPSKTYVNAGTYSVRLTVTDNRGASATRTDSVTVSSGSNLPECAGGDSRVLGPNCTRSNRGATAGNYDYFYVLVPAGTASLRITTRGGTGDCDLLYSAATWATLTSATDRSTAAGNTELLTIAAPAQGYRYVSLYGRAGCSGVTVTTQF